MTPEQIASNETEADAAFVVPGAPQIDVEIISPHRTPCYGYTDLFFGKNREIAEERAQRVAKAGLLCSICTLQVPCREGAEERGEVLGVWGGVDFESKARLRRQAERLDNYFGDGGD